MINPLPMSDGERGRKALFEPRRMPRIDIRGDEQENRSQSQCQGATMLSPPDTP